MSVTDLPLAIASKRGFFKEEGIDVELIQVAGSPAVAALVAGDVDYIAHTSRIVAMAARGGGVKLIFSHAVRPSYYLVAVPEIKEVRNLKGLTVGISSFGGTSYRLTKLMLEHFGLYSPDVTLRVLGDNALRLAAMAGKSLQATLLPAEYIIRAREMGFKVLAYSGDVVELPMNGLGTTSRKIAASSDEARHVIRASLRGLRFLHEDREGSIAVMMDWRKLTPANAAAAYDLSARIFGRDGAPTDKGLRLLLSITQEDLKLAKEILPEEVTDFTILNGVRKESRIQ
jgi:NitT/TauT family transport system substrate-binding protein